MSSVVSFPRKHSLHLTKEQRKLRDFLARSTSIQARGGSVDVGAGGVVLFRNSHALGCWTIHENGYQWSPIATGATTLSAASVEAAHDKSLEILGTLPEDRFQQAIEQYHGAAEGYARSAMLETVIRASRGVAGNTNSLPPELVPILGSIARQYQAFYVCELRPTQTYADAAVLLKRLFF